MSTPKITAADLRAMKGRRRIASLTAYDFPMTKLLDAAGINSDHIIKSVKALVSPS